MSGFILLHRGWRDNPIFKGEFSRADAWVWLIENACWKETSARIKGSSMELRRGELTFSQRFLAEKWGWSKSRVDRFIADLRKQSMIETRSKNGATEGHAAGQGQCIITICNYAKYQDMGKSVRGNNGDGKRGNSGATAGQQRGKEEQGNKGNKEPKEETPPTPLMTEGVEIPDWIPSAQWLAFIDMRKRKDAQPTAHAVELLIAKLDRFRSAGHDPGVILDNSTLSNWTGIFEPKDNRNGNQGSNGYAPRDNRDGTFKTLERQLFGDRPEQPSGEAGRFDIGEGGSDSLLPVAHARIV